MSYAIAKQTADYLTARYRLCGKIMNTFPKDARGLTPDSVKATTEWKQAKAKFDKAFGKLREFNVYFLNRYRLEIAAERKRG